MKDIKVSWNRVERGAEKIARAARKAKFRPDCIVAILQGGIVPARLVANHFKKIEIYTIRVKSYSDRRRRGRVRMGRFCCDILGKNVLLVDDIHDSGITLKKTAERLMKQRPRALRTGTLFYKRSAVTPPDFFSDAVYPGVWVIFPWERRG